MTQQYLCFDIINSMANIPNTNELSQSALQTTAIRVVQRPENQQNQARQQLDHFLFQGDETAFAQMLRSMTQQEIDKTAQCDICIIGQEIKPGNLKILVLTLLVGFCFIFPFFFFFCQWWKRAVSQIFQIKQEIYGDIAKILRGKKLDKINVKIYDNFLTEKKIKIMARSLVKKTKIKKLTFINEAGAFDMNDNEYSNFLINTKSFLKVSIKQWNINWYKQYLKSQKSKV